MTDSKQTDPTNQDHESSKCRPESSQRMTRHVNRCAILLPIGTSLGILLGFLFWTRIPTQYKAVVRLQISTSSVLTDQLRNSSAKKEVALLQSMVILRDAVEQDGLNKNALLTKLSFDEQVQMLRRCLDVKLVSDIPGTGVVDVAFRCEDSRLCEEAVSAIVSSYERFIQHDMQSVSDSSDELQTVSLSSKPITNVRKDVKRLEVSNQDGPWLWHYLALSGFLGACLFTLPTLLLYRNAISE